jgi:hypothetical protein
MQKKHIKKEMLYMFFAFIVLTGYIKILRGKPMSNKKGSIRNLTNHKSICILTSSTVERMKILDILITDGYRWHGESHFTADRIEQQYPFAEWPVVEIKLGRLNYMHGRTTHSAAYTITVSQFLEGYYDNS